MDKKNLVSILELKKLLFDLRDSNSDVCIRFRLVGEMWQANHARILVLTEKGVILNDEDQSKVISISDINSIIQFELDKAFKQYQPHFHYSIGAF